MHGFDFSVHLFSTRVRGTRIVVTLQLVTNVLYVPRVEHPDYLDCECLRTMYKDEMIFAFLSVPQIGVIVNLHNVRPLLKVLDS